MKKSRFSDSQIMAILKQAEAGTGVPDLYREHGISTAIPAQAGIQWPSLFFTL